MGPFRPTGGGSAAFPSAPDAGPWASDPYDGDRMDRPPPNLPPSEAELPRLEDLPIACILADAAGVPRNWNAAAEPLLGRDLLERSPDRWGELVQVLGDDGRAVPPTALPFGRAAVDASGVPAERLLTLHRDAAPPRTLAMLALPWAEGSLTLVRQADRARRIAEAGREQTDDLQRRLRRQQAIVRTAAVAGGAGDAGDEAGAHPRLVRLLESVVAGLPADAAAIVLRPAATANPTVMVTGGIDPAAFETLHAGGAGGWITRERRPLTVASPAVDPFATPGPRPVAAWAAVPLPGEGDDGEPVGILYAAFRHEHACDADDLSYLEAVADQAAGIVIRGRLVATLRRQARELEAHRDHLESLVADRTADLEASHARLRIADRLAAIGTFTAGLGHDMENVLLPLRCRLDAIPDAAIDAGGPLADVARATRTAVAFLRQLADGLRLLARDPLAPGPAAATDLAGWWAQVEPLLRHTVPSSRRLEAAIAADLPPVAIPAAGLTQAVLNLVVNAADATAADGLIRITADCAEAAEPGPGDGPRVCLSVRDDGRGMSPEVAAQAFDPFFSTRTRTMSTGLGLWLVHQIMERAGGRVHLETTPGAGTCFTLEMPAAARTDVDHASSSAAGDHRVARLRVTDPRRRAWIQRLLEDAGWRVDLPTPVDAGEKVDAGTGTGTGTGAGAGAGADTIILAPAAADRHDSETIEIRLGGPPPTEARTLHVPDPDDLAAIRRLLADRPPLPETSS